MQWVKQIAYAAAAIITISSCSGEKQGPEDTMTSGTIDISVDETYKPVIEAQMKVFDSSFPDAEIRIHYKPESECFKDLVEEKARLILVTRELLPEEKPLYEQRKIVTHSMALARDAVAVIVHPSSPDSMLSLSQIRGMLTGVYHKNYTVVFDNQGSSTVRFVTDSLIPGEKLDTSKVFAAKGNEEVVDYVAAHPEAVGFIGLSYVSDVTDPDTEAFLQKVKVAGIYHDSAQRFYRPYQAYIAMKLYPLTRDLYFISRENYAGLGTGFINFLSKERGQLIFASSRLFPLRMNIVIRDATINRQ
jgi:phosphate transport system substrate-binding protein